MLGRKRGYLSTARAGDHKSTTSVFDTRSGELLATATSAGKPSRVRACALSHDGEHVLAAGDNGCFRRWRIG